MKKLKKLFTDFRYYGEGEAEIEISLWHVIAIAGIIIFSIYTCNR